VVVEFSYFCIPLRRKRNREKEQRKRVSKKICKTEKDFYLCSPKQNGGYQTEFVNGIKKIEIEEWLNRKRGAIRPCRNTGQDFKEI
jgi:hypothetical protein